MCPHPQYWFTTSINYKCYTNVRGAFDFDRKTGWIVTTLGHFKIFWEMAKKRRGSTRRPADPIRLFHRPHLFNQGLFFLSADCPYRQKSAPFRTIPEWTDPFPKPWNLWAALLFHGFTPTLNLLQKTKMKAKSKKSASPMLKGILSTAPHLGCIPPFYIAALGQWSEGTQKHCFCFLRHLERVVLVLITPRGIPAVKVPPYCQIQKNLYFFFILNYSVNII